MSSADPRPGLPDYIVTFGPDANCTLELCPLEYSLYGYLPSIPANATFIALFGLAACLHIFLGVRWRQWSFMGCMLAGCVAEIVGYAGRVAMHHNPFAFISFMLQISKSLSSPEPRCLYGPGLT